MFSEDELLALSGLQHMAFCGRRWALVHVECVWEDNRFTAEGKQLHEKAHSGEIETRPGVLIRRTLPVRSFRLGLSGQADIVEFYPVHGSEPGIALEGRRGRWCPYPVEYKRRRDHAGSVAYRIQLCAQAICLEEMLRVAVPEGCVYDGTAKRRQTVAFGGDLRAEVERLSSRMHTLRLQGVTPPAVLMKACPKCSLVELCQPKALAGVGSARRYLDRSIRELLEAR